MATAVLQRTPLARGPAATRSTQPPVLFPLPPVVFPEPPSAATAQEASGVGGRGGRVLRRRVASGAIRSREKGGEKSSKASPDPDEKVLLISGAPAAPLPNTKLSPREAPQEPTDGEYSCWVKADVTGRRERSIPERRIGVKAAAGWSERKGVAWSRGLLAFPRARNHRASSFRAIKKGFSAAITEARLMRMARGRVGVGRAVRKKQRRRQKHRGNVVFFPASEFPWRLVQPKNF